jgi:uncharacterized membrane protein YkoI
MQPLRVVMALSLTVIFGIWAAASGQEMKFADGPAAVRKTFEAEAKGSRIETIHKEKAEDDTVYWAEVTIGGKAYAVGVLEDGTLTEMNLAVAEDELPFDQCPAAVQSTFRREAFGEKVESVGKDVKYGVPIYEAAVKHRGRSYEIVVAEDGTLVEKVLVIEDEEVELAKCPATVQTAFKAHARGGTIGDVTRSTGIGRPTFEAEVKIKDKVYLIEVAENGSLISKSLEAGEE